MPKNAGNPASLLHAASAFLTGIAVLFAPALCRAQGYTITTVGAGQAPNVILAPLGVAVDATGNVYVTQNPSIYDFVSEVSPDGTISAIAGTAMSLGGNAGDGGPATSAQLNFPLSVPGGIAVDSAGDIYIADSGNQRIRMISPSGVIMTIAGGATPSASASGTLNLGDGGPATLASLGQPQGVAVDSAGNLYIADTVFNLVRKVTPDGMIATVAGCVLGPTCIFSLGDGGPATSVVLKMPTAVAVDSSGNLYIAEKGNNRIRKVSTDGTITTVAGSGAGSYQGDGGPATSAGLNQPNGVAVDSAGNIYIADGGDYRIRMVTPDSTITTIAGNGAQRLSGDSSGDGGPATSAKFLLILGIAVDGGGNVYVVDGVFGVRMLTPNAAGSGS